MVSKRERRTTDVLPLALWSPAFNRYLAMVQKTPPPPSGADLNALDGDQPAGPNVRALLDRSVRRLRLLCANLLYHKYRRLTLPPLNLPPDELLSAVVERLLKAMRSVHPQTVRPFFALVNQHMRWKLNDLARRLDEQP